MTASLPAPDASGWTPYDRRVVEQAERMSEASEALTDALMASHRSHPRPVLASPEAVPAGSRPGLPPPDPLWLAYLERARAVNDNVFDALEEMLALLPVPHATRVALSPSQARRLGTEQVLDTMNLAAAPETFRRRAARVNAFPMGSGQRWFGAHRPDLVHRFGKPSAGFRSYDGLFGQWWFEVRDHPWIGAHERFNVCAGPTGMRAGLVTAERDPATTRRWNERERVTLDMLLVVWFHSSVALALDPASPNPWLRVKPWTFEERPV